MSYPYQRTVAAIVVRAWLVVGDKMEETKQLRCVCFIQLIYLTMLFGDHLGWGSCQFFLESESHSLTIQISLISPHCHSHASIII